MRFLIQTPELHSAHHELDVHTPNFADIPLWDRLFGTYGDRPNSRRNAAFQTAQKKS